MYIFAEIKNWYFWKRRLKPINKRLKMSPIKNTFWFRHFLICHVLANKMMEPRGWLVDNFALSILESENGRYGNDQMNVYFRMADIFLCGLHESENDQVFENLENEDDVDIEDLAKLSAKEIQQYYKKYCIGKIDFIKVTN